ncbi:MAG: hypothetical protein ACRC6E_11155 [Fusobacteriaceae bacterium]
MKIRKIDGQYVFADLVGKEFLKDDIKCWFVSFDNIFKTLSIRIDESGQQIYMCDEVISLAFGESAFLERLTSFYGITIEEEDVVDDFSGEVVGEAYNLTEVGFDYLEIIDDKIYAKSSTDELAIMNVTNKFSESIQTSTFSRQVNKIPLKDFFAKHIE